MNHFWIILSLTLSFLEEIFKMEFKMEDKGKIAVNESFLLTQLQ